MSDIKVTTFKRILSAVVALPVYIFAFMTDLFNSIPVLIVSIIITVTCLYEYYKICDKGEVGRPFMAWGIISAIAINIIFYMYAFGKSWNLAGALPSLDATFDARAILGVLTFFLAIILILQIFKRQIQGGIYSAATTVFGVIYIVFFFSHIILMKALTDGIYYILLLNIVVMINDSGAYFGGVLFGKHKTNFAVSPNKSWEGYLSGLLASIIAIIVSNEIFESFLGRHLFTFIESIFLGILLSIFGHIGDLVESAIKRDSVIKDSGSIIPGHGGMWDVFDALIFTFPIFYYYLVLKGIT